MKPTAKWSGHLNEKIPHSNGKEWFRLKEINLKFYFALACAVAEADIAFSK